MPVYFIDLDGVHERGRRIRRTTVLAYDDEEVVHRGQIAVPVSKHPVDSVNLRDPRNRLRGTVARLAGAERGGQGADRRFAEPR